MFSKREMKLIDAGFGMAGDGLWIDPDTGEVMTFERALLAAAVEKDELSTWNTW